MAQINVQIQNDTSDSWNVHVYDLFGNGHREVATAPFALAAGEVSPLFQVNADGDGTGKVEWRADGGPSLSDVEVTDGFTIPMQ